jgi:hypothetical protein
MTGRRKPRPPIAERVSQVHLDHFCPGGAGLPVTGSGPIGLSIPDIATEELDGNAARAAGQLCERSDQPVMLGQDVRRRLSGGWVHEQCPRRAA